MVLNNQQKRNLAFGAILFYYNSEPILDIKIKGKKEDHIEQLNTYWGVHDHKSALERIERFLSLENSSEIDVLLEAPSPEINAIIDRIANGLELHFSEVSQVKSTNAWDVCRLIVLAKWCYWVDYISLDEMWDFITEATKKTSKLNKDWKQYTISFLLGRTIHGLELDTIIDETKELFYSKRSTMAWLLRVKDIDVYKKYSFK